MQRELLSKRLGYDVTPETYGQLHTYVRLVEQWQPAMNLVAPSTMGDIWERHILDSVQLFRFIKEPPSSLVDIGSGGGFPGMILAILFPAAQITLVESDRRKCIFLQNVSRETFSPITIFNHRMETFISPPVDMITSRACASLSELLALSQSISSKATRFLLHKGKMHQQEIEEARKGWSFSLEIHASLVHKESVILDLTSVEKRTDG